MDSLWSTQCIITSFPHAYKSSGNSGKKRSHHSRGQATRRAKVRPSLPPNRKRDAVALASLVPDEYETWELSPRKLLRIQLKRCLVIAIVPQFAEILLDKRWEASVGFDLRHVPQLVGYQVCIACVVLPDKNTVAVGQPIGAVQTKIPGDLKKSWIVRQRHFAHDQYANLLVKANTGAFRSFRLCRRERALGSPMVQNGLFLAFCPGYGLWHEVVQLGGLGHLSR